jgi:hypothetical protein
MNKLLVTAATLTLFSTLAFAQASSSENPIAPFLPLSFVLVTGYFYRRHKNKMAKIHEQRLIDIENSLERLEGS